MSDDPNFSRPADPYPSPVAVAVPTLSLLTLILNVTPLMWHVRNRNLPASALVFWVMLGNLMSFVNALVWPTDDLEEWWPGFVLCDIEAKLMVAEFIAVISCLLCIMRNLARVLDTDRPVLSMSQSEKRRRAAFEGLLCFGAPVYLMAVHYIVQPNRYYVFAISGCIPSFNNSWPKLALVFIWPPIVCLGSVYYSGLVLVRIYRYRKNFSEILSSADSSLTRNRFLRLFILAMVLIALVLPVQAYVLYKNLAVHFGPFSWAEIHSTEAWRQITFIPSNGSVFFDRWIQICSGIGIFFFFGVGRDALVLYRKFLLRLGFGKIFKNLNQDSVPRQFGSDRRGQECSISGRACLVITEKFKRIPRIFRHRVESHDTPFIGSQVSLGWSRRSGVMGGNAGWRVGSTSPSSLNQFKTSSPFSPSQIMSSWLRKFMRNTQSLIRTAKPSSDLENAQDHLRPAEVVDHEPAEKSKVVESQI